MAEDAGRINNVRAGLHVVFSQHGVYWETEQGQRLLMTEDEKALVQRLLEQHAQIVHWKKEALAHSTVLERFKVFTVKHVQDVSICEGGWPQKAGAPCMGCGAYDNQCKEAEDGSERTPG